MNMKIKCIDCDNYIYIEYIEESNGVECNHCRTINLASYQNIIDISKDEYNKYKSNNSPTIYTRNSSRMIRITKFQTLLNLSKIYRILAMVIVFLVAAGLSVIVMMFDQYERKIFGFLNMFYILITGCFGVASLIGTSEGIKLILEIEKNPLKQTYLLNRLLNGINE